MYTHIEENIYSIFVPLPGNPLKNLNAYFIKSESGRNLLIDTGFRQDECRQALLAGLDELGVSMENTDIFLSERERNRIVSANAYLGGRAIRRGLEEGADIVICGRVADASPVIGAAAWWHNWGDYDFDALAGALVAGHLIECSSYITGVSILVGTASALLIPTTGQLRGVLQV